MSVASDTRIRSLDAVLDAALSRSTADRGLLGKVVDAVKGAAGQGDLDNLAAEPESLLGAG